VLDSTNQGVPPRSWDVVEPDVDANAIRAAVDLFSARMMADPELSDIFAAAGMPDLRAHQQTFLLRALGGPDLYAGRDMREAHDGLGITDAQFDRAIAHLIASLNEVGVDPDVVERAAADTEALRALIVSAL
jgi:hemoglobin